MCALADSVRQVYAETADYLAAVIGSGGGKKKGGVSERTFTPPFGTADICSVYADFLARAAQAAARPSTPGNRERFLSLRNLDA